MERAPSPSRPAGTTATPAVSRRGRRFGSVIAVVVLAAIVALAWYLTHRPAAVAPGSPAAVGARAGNAARAGGQSRAAPPSTVGVATAAPSGAPPAAHVMSTFSSCAVNACGSFSAASPDSPNHGGIVPAVTVFRIGQVATRASS